MAAGDGQLLTKRGRRSPERLRPFYLLRSCQFSEFQLGSDRATRNRARENGEAREGSFGTGKTRSISAHSVPRHLSVIVTGELVGARGNFSALGYQIHRLACHLVARAEDLGGNVPFWR